MSLGGIEVEREESMAAAAVSSIATAASSPSMASAGQPQSSKAAAAGGGGGSSKVSCGWRASSTTTAASLTNHVVAPLSAAAAATARVTRGQQRSRTAIKLHRNRQLLDSVEARSQALGLNEASQHRQPPIHHQLNLNLSLNLQQRSASSGAARVQSRDQISAATSNTRVRQGALFARRQYHMTATSFEAPTSATNQDQQQQASQRDSKTPLVVAGTAASKNQQLTGKRPQLLATSSSSSRSSDALVLCQSQQVRKKSPALLLKTGHKFTLSSSSLALANAGIVVKRAKQSQQLVNNTSDNSSNFHRLKQAIKRNNNKLLPAAAAATTSLAAVLINRQERHLSSAAASGGYLQKKVATTTTSDSAEESRRASVGASLAQTPRFAAVAKQNTATTTTTNSTKATPAAAATVIAFATTRQRANSNAASSADNKTLLVAGALLVSRDQNKQIATTNPLAPDNQPNLQQVQHLPPQATKQSLLESHQQPRRNSINPPTEYNQFSNQASHRQQRIRLQPNHKQMMISNTCHQAQQQQQQQQQHQQATSFMTNMDNNNLKSAQKSPLCPLQQSTNSHRIAATHLNNNNIRPGKTNKSINIEEGEQEELCEVENLPPTKLIKQYNSEEKIKSLDSKEHLAPQQQEEDVELIDQGTSISSESLANQANLVLGDEVTMQKESSKSISTTSINSSTSTADRMSLGSPLVTPPPSELEDDDDDHVESANHHELTTLTNRQDEKITTPSLPVVVIDIPIKTEDINELYQLEARPFARGKFAQVKRATCKTTKQCFAAKCIKKRRRLVDIRKEILLEIEALKLSYASERIVKLYEVYETPTEMILLLELANGELQTLLDEQEFICESSVKTIIRQILEGLEVLHENNIIHLDIKPQNLLLTKTGDVKLCDFGLSRRMTKNCEIREICGTPDYVAPEILRYDPISFSADLWSVGVLTYVLLSGYSPFGSDNKQQTFCNITQSKLEFPTEFDKISDEAIDFMQKLMLQQPTERMTTHQALNHPWLWQTN